MAVHARARPHENWFSVTTPADIIATDRRQRAGHTGIVLVVVGKEVNRSHAGAEEAGLQAVQYFGHVI